MCIHIWWYNGSYYYYLLMYGCCKYVLFHYRGKVTRMYYFILHLSIADLFTAFFTLIPEFAWTFTLPKFYGGNVACKLMKYFFVIGPYLSSYTLVMTAVDRYQVILIYKYYLYTSSPWTTLTAVCCNTNVILESLTAAVSMLCIFTGKLNPTIKVVD